MDFAKTSQVNRVTRSLKKLNVSLIATFTVIFVFWLLLFSTKKYDGDVLFTNLFYYAFTAENIKGILQIFAPFLIGAVAVLICFRVGFINIGVSGQMAASGLTIFLLADSLQQAEFAKNPALWTILLILVGMLVAGLVAFFCAALKIYFGISEILTTIILNYFIFYIFRYVVTHPDITNPTGRLQSIREVDHFMGFNVFVAFIPVALFIAFFFFALCAFVFEKTTYGFQIKIIGKNKKASAYAGINYQRQTLFLVLMMGFLAGLAGVLYYYRNFDNNYLFITEALPFNGFDTISIVWLAQSSFLALPLVTFFVALLRHQQYTIPESALPNPSVELILGFVLFSVAFASRLVTMSESERIEWRNKIAARFPQLVYNWNNFKKRFKLKLQRNSKIAKKGN